MRILVYVGLISIVAQTKAQIPKVSAGKIEQHRIESKYLPSRTVDVWLPVDYSLEQQYAVLYMHDGQMLFDSTLTWNMQEWQVDEVMSRLLTSNEIRNTIVVGIYNTPNRHSEYFPQRVYEQLSFEQVEDIKRRSAEKGRALFEQQVQSDNYLKFIVNELKPFIDQNYRTYTDPTNTFIAGSSMGGLISLYALCEYPSVFGGAACLSTHWPGIMVDSHNPVPKLLFEYLNEKLPNPGKHRFYFDHGTINLDAAYPPLQAKVDVLFNNKGYDSGNYLSLSFPGADHHEKAWSERLHLPLKFLLGCSK